MSNRLITDLWLLAKPMQAHNIGESDRTAFIFSRLNLIVFFLRGAIDSNQAVWLLANPYAGSLLHL